MSYSNRIFIYGPVGLLLLIVVLYSVYWRVQADTLSARLDRANGGEVIPGIKFAFAEKSVGGYPFRLDAVLSGVSFSQATNAGEATWRTEKLALHSQSYGRNRYLFEVTGLQSFSLPPQKPGGPPREILLTPAIARASAILRDGRLVRFDLDLLELQGKDATPGADANGNASADRAQLHLLARADNTVDVAMKFDNARIGADAELPLIDLRGKLMAGEAFTPLTAGQTSPADAATAWRDRMGTFSVTALSLNWPDARAILKGDLTLNAQDRLTGRLAGERVQRGGTSAQFALVFADGVMRLATSALGRSGP
jgi:hypothetical protein